MLILGIVAFLGRPTFSNKSTAIKKHLASFSKIEEVDLGRNSSSQLALDPKTRFEVSYYADPKSLADLEVRQTLGEIFSKSIIRIKHEVSLKKAGKVKVFDIEKIAVIKKLLESRLGIKNKKISDFGITENGLMLGLANRGNYSDPNYEAVVEIHNYGQEFFQNWQKIYSSDDYKIAIKAKIASNAIAFSRFRDDRDENVLIAVDAYPKDGPKYSLAYLIKLKSNTEIPQDSDAHGSENSNSNRSTTPKPTATPQPELIKLAASVAVSTTTSTPAPTTTNSPAPTTTKASSSPVPTATKTPCVEPTFVAPTYNPLSKNFFYTPRPVSGTPTSVPVAKPGDALPGTLAQDIKDCGAKVGPYGPGNQCVEQSNTMDGCLNAKGWITAFCTVDVKQVCRVLKFCPKQKKAGDPNYVYQPDDYEYFEWYYGHAFVLVRPKGTDENGNPKKSVVVHNSGNTKGTNFDINNDGNLNLALGGRDGDWISNPEQYVDGTDRKWNPSPVNDGVSGAECWDLEAQVRRYPSYSDYKKANCPVN